MSRHPGDALLEAFWDGIEVGTEDDLSLERASLPRRPWGVGDELGDRHIAALNHDLFALLHETNQLGELGVRFVDRDASSSRACDIR